MVDLIKHGGNLREASEHYQIPFHDWVDLSTGINPNGWTPPEIPSHVWQRLPEDDDGLIDVAKQYYGVENILPISGSQAAIQALPHCRRTSRVGIISPAYAEYAFCWRQAKHEVIEIDRNDVDSQLHTLDVLIVINPNNPDTYLHSTNTLKTWHDQLAKNNGWLIVDEAFMDSTPEHSLLQQDVDNLPNLIVLRSLGKFFGLAGLRLGFIAANNKIINQLTLRLGAWPVSHPARWLGKKALLDSTWQEKTRTQLQHQSKVLRQSLLQCNIAPLYCTSLFCYFKAASAKALQEHLAQQAIWIRIFEQNNAVRIGLTKNSSELELLSKALSKWAER